jgi:hypothetical protein
MVEEAAGGDRDNKIVQEGKYIQAMLFVVQLT